MSENRLRARLIALAPPASVFLTALVVLVIVSRATAPSFEELWYVGAVEQKAELVKRIAAQGFAQLLLPENRAALEPQPGVLLLIAAWTKLALGRGLDPLTAERLPWLMLGAASVLSVYALLRPTRGVFIALGAAFLLLFTPRFLHAIVVRREAALVLCFWLPVLATYARALDASRTRMCWSAASAALLGFGAAVSFGTLWVLPVILIHFAWLRGARTRRALRRGLVPVPGFTLLSLAIGPGVMLVMSPGLWRQTGAGLARFALAPLAPAIFRSEYAGKVVSAPPVPGGFALASILQTLPWLLLVAALVGIGVAFHQSLARRFASGRFRPERDRYRVALLAIIGLAAVTVGPAFTPEVLTTFPPRIEIAIPFLAMLAAIGIERLVRIAPSPLLGRIALAITALALVVTTLASPSTLSAATSPLVGGAGRIAKTHALPLGDGSELGALAPAIDALGAEAIGLRMPPDVPPEIWDALKKSRRMKTTITRGGTLGLARGNSTEGQRVAQVKRDGAVLWTLSR